jgi:dihydrofolate synthase/folylpolyglutamate synthase
MPSENIETYRDALRAIWLRSAYDRGFISNPFWGDEAADLGLQRTKTLLHLLGDPHLAYHVVHVSGSKGKGSTCTFLSEILTAADYATGLYTSPHLHAFRERIAVEGTPISEQGFAWLTQEVLAKAENLEVGFPELGEVTAFELTTAMALLFFAKEGCEFAVIEVGLGGTLDATNVVSPAVSIITALDFEHTQVLGSTLSEIAKNKAGIIKPEKPVISVAQQPEALKVIERTARKNTSQLLLEGRDWTVLGDWRNFTVDTPWETLEELRSSLPGRHQAQNAGAAVVTALLLNEQEANISESAIRDGLLTATWPGRYEVVVQPEQPKIILDGAHTPASARALVATVLLEDAGQDRAIVLGMMADKDPSAFAKELATLQAPIVVTASRSPRAASVHEVVTGVEGSGLDSSTARDVNSALSAASKLAGVKGTVIVTGSLAVVAEAREALGLAVPDPPVDDASLARSNTTDDSQN